MPKSGHSRNARDGTGFRTRLRARVLHLRSGRVSLALIAADLHAGSAVVHRLVSGALAGVTDVPRAGLFFGATHTHAGPGQFHGSDFYNRWASNRPGLDPDYTAFVARQLAGAVRLAHDSRRPARLATGSAEVWGFTRNRSLAAHVDNVSVPDKRTAPQRRYAAVNPWLHLIRVDTTDPSGGLTPLAAYAFFSIHGTGISRHDPAYNADVWAYITGEMAAGIESRTGTRPVCGAVEGTHGDVTPAVRPGLLVYPEAERVGRGIGAAAAALHDRLESGLTAAVRLGAGLCETDLSRRPVVAGVRLPDPAVGAAKLAGAVENTTPLLDRLPPFRPGFPKPAALARSGQGRKWIVGGRTLQRRVVPDESFPSLLPVQCLVVGGFCVVGLPFEVTVEAGRRIERAVGAARGEAASARVVVSSAANDYWDYLTTPEEYDRQCYEGASNLYGPRTLEVVSALAAELAVSLEEEPVVQRTVAGRRFDGVIARYLAPVQPPGAGPPRRVVGAPRFVDADRWDDGYWEMEWTGGRPGSLEWHRPLARVERLTPAGWVAEADDGGWRVGVFAERGDDDDGCRYWVRWFQPPLGEPGCWRFVLEANHSHPSLTGPVFD